MPNGSLREFSLINETFNKCLTNPEILIFPLFLDDTRENTIREFVQNFDNLFCKIDKKILPEEKINQSNLRKLEKILKKDYKILQHLQGLNTKFRTDLYKFRNFVFMIKPNSIRPIKKSAYFSNINAYKKILSIRNKNNLKTIVYIPPLLYADIKNKIPYNEKEYKSFKKETKEICNRHKCFFYNLESNIESSLWGNKLSTNILRTSNEIDFMHFTGKGHLELSNDFSLIIQKHITSK